MRGAELARLKLYRDVVSKLRGQACEKAWAEQYWSAHDLPLEASYAANLRREGRLLARLRRAGVKGWPERRTLYTRSLPPGCRTCVRGLGACLSVTNVCTRDCFFCPNPKPRRDEVCLGGYPMSRPGDAAELIGRFGLKSIGISGGDPLTRLPRTLRMARAIRRRHGPGFWMQLYTNGDLLTDEALRRIKRAGISEVRINLVANEFDLEPVKRAVRHFRHVSIELPVLPVHKLRLKRLIDELDELGVGHLILHELAYSKDNREAIAARGYGAKSPRYPVKGMRPISGSAVAALELLLHALRKKRRLSVYYCSHDTIETINLRGARHRHAMLSGPGPNRI